MEKTIPNLSSATQARIEEVSRLRKAGLPTLPVSLQAELDTNPFLRLDDPAIVKAVGGKEGDDESEIFRKLREMKEVF